MHSRFPFTMETNKVWNAIIQAHKGIRKPAEEKQEARNSFQRSAVRLFILSKQV